jgi:hypothetical protein
MKSYPILKTTEGLSPSFSGASGISKFGIGAGASISNKPKLLWGF